MSKHNKNRNDIEVDPSDLSDLIKDEDAGLAPTLEESPVLMPPNHPDYETNPLKEPTMPEPTPIKSNVVVPPVNKPVVTPARTIGNRFTMLSREYITLANSGLTTVEKQKRAVELISDMAMLVTTSHDSAIFDECLGFMLKHRAIMLSEQTVLGHVTEYADANKVNRIVQFYVIFTALIESKLQHRRFTLNLNHVKDIFNNRQFVEWLALKR